MRSSSASRQMSWMMSMAICAFSLEDENTVTLPSSSTSILAPVFSWIPRMTLPPGPMISRIFSGRIRMVMNLGANSESAVQLRLAADVLDDVDGHLRLFAGGREYRHLAVVLHVDLGPRLLLDPANDLAAGADDFPDLLRAAR